MPHRMPVIPHKFASSREVMLTSQTDEVDLDTIERPVAVMPDQVPELTRRSITLYLSDPSEPSLP